MLWNVLPGEKYFPIYFEGLVLESYGAKDNQQDLEQLIQSAQRQIAVDPASARATELTPLVQRRFSIGFNEAACLVGEIRAWKRKQKPLPSLPRRYYVKMRTSDGRAVLRRTEAGLREIEPMWPLRAKWAIGMQARDKRNMPQRPTLRASALYQWEAQPPDVESPAQAWIDLECSASDSSEQGCIDLTFSFHDELGFLFEEAQQIADRTAAAAAPAARRDGRFAQARRTYDRPPRMHPSSDHARQPSLPDEPTITSAVLAREERLTWMVASSYIRKADDLIGAGPAARALGYADAAVQLADASCFRSARGFVHLAVGNTKLAHDDFAAALFSHNGRGNARNASAFLGQALAYYRDGNRQEALAWCNSSIGWGLANGALYEVRGCICHDIGNFGQAVDDYNQARKLLGVSYPARLDAFILQAENQNPRKDVA